MTQLTRRPFASMNAAKQSVDSKPVKLPRLLASSAFALLSLATFQPPAAAQSLNNGQICYTIADNNPPAQGNGGGTDFPDTLVRIDDFAARAVTVIANPIARSGGGTVNGIEALTSRPNFNELIAANENEIGVIDPETGEFTSIGFIDGFQDFDAIAIDRNSDNQTRLIGISKRRGADRENAIVEVFIELDENNQSVGISAPTTDNPPRIAPDQFPAGTNSIDGIALDPNTGTAYGVANSGPLSAQRFVVIDLGSGALQDRGPFLSVNGTEVNDIEDLSFDLVDNILFASSGSNVREAFTEFGFIYSNPGDGDLGNALDEFDIEDAAGSNIIDYEASACILQDVVTSGNLLLVKRITAVTPVGSSEQRFNDFENQQGDTFDDEMQTATDGAFPFGIIQPNNPLSPGDLVEYTVYIYNNSSEAISNLELCDPLNLPNILQADSIEVVPPNSDLSLAFSDFDDVIGARSPQRPIELSGIDRSCSESIELIDGNTDNFPSADSGVVGPGGQGGGVVVDFDEVAGDSEEGVSLGSGQIAAVRFVVEVGTLASEDSSDN